MKNIPNTISTKIEAEKKYTRNNRLANLTFYFLHFWAPKQAKTVPKSKNAIVH